MKERLKKLSKAAAYSKKKVAALKSSLNKAERTNSKSEADYQNRILELEEEVAHGALKDDFKKEGKTFSDKMRMMVYECIMSNVPTDKIPPLVLSFATKFGVDITAKDIPVRSSVENMVAELGLLSDLQVAEFIHKSTDVTIGFDATTQEGVHVNAIHTTSEHKCLVVALDQLAGGTAKDYSQHIIDSVAHLAHACQFHTDASFSDVHGELISHISCTLSDRAAANHAAIRLVNEAFGKTLIEVNCHLHPLDTIATRCRTALRSLETEKSKLFGNGCLAEKIILALNKMRFKDGKGDPHGFRVFLRDNNLPQSLIVRYRGNRLHVLFKLAATYITHYEMINLYLSTRCLNTSNLKTALIQDFTDPMGYLELKVLAVLGKILTGPWMKCMYRSHDKQLHHMDAFEKVQECSRKVEALAAEDVIQLDKITHDFFGAPLDHSDNESVWKDDVDADKFSNMFKAVLGATTEVITKQYQRYHHDMEVSDEMKRKLASARTHNIDSEEVMGMFSAAQARAPRATLLFISSKIRAKKNNTTAYISSHAEAEALVMKSVTVAAKLKRSSQKSVVELQKELSERIADKMQKKQEGERRKMGKNLKELMGSTDPDYAAAFPSLENSSLEMLMDIVAGTVVGKKMLHNWAQEGSFLNKTYNGKVEKLKKTSKAVAYVVCYWGLNETYEEDGEDYNIPLHELAVDFICGDLEFTSC